MFNQVQNKNSEISEANTIYGIRTNTNAVREYCNLLINFLEDQKYDELKLRLIEFKCKKEDVVLAD